MLVEIRFHGSGGQGVVVAANLFASAAAEAGYHIQSFAAFGVERRGGNVESYVRISDKKLFVHSKMYEPDYVVIMKEGLTKNHETLSGLRKGKSILINSPLPPEDFFTLRAFNIFTIDGSRIAKEHGVCLSSGEPIVNTTMLGGLAGILGLINVHQLAKVFRQRNIPSHEKNINAAKEAYHQIKSGSNLGGKVYEHTDTEISAEDYPTYHLEKMRHCNKCMICYIFCPDLAIKVETEPFSLHVDNNLCKRCGICVQECPVNAISMER